MKIENTRCILISILPGKDSRTLFELRGRYQGCLLNHEACDSITVLKPCLVNLITKYIHLLFTSWFTLQTGDL